MAPISTCMGCYCRLWTPQPVYWIRRLSPPSLLYTDETWAPPDHLTHPDNGFFFSGQSLTFCTVIIIIDISLCLYFSFVWHVCKVTGRYKFKSLIVMRLIFHLDSLSSLSLVPCLSNLHSWMESLARLSSNVPNRHWTCGHRLTHPEENFPKTQTEMPGLWFIPRTDSLFKHDLSSSSSLKVAPSWILSDRLVGTFKNARW